MKLIAVIEADMQTAPPGTASRLEDDLAGAPVLRRTAERVLGCEGVDAVFVSVPTGQAEAAQGVLAGLPVRIAPTSHGPPTWRDAVRAGRKWALGSWRGGIATTCWFDECLNPAALADIVAAEQAAGGLLVPGHAAVVDPALLTQMAAHFRQHHEAVPFVFTQAPPGLAGVIIGARLASDLPRVRHHLGRLIGYRPDNPTPDVTTKLACLQVPGIVAHTQGRFLADTQVGFERLGALISDLADSGGPDALAACQWWRRHAHDTPPLPREVELELTTRDPLACSSLRPRGATVGERGPIDTDLVQRLCASLAARDDALLVLGGFGEPCEHPGFAEVLRIARREGIFGLAIRSNALDWNDATIDALLEARTDVINLLIDAMTPETYQAVHGIDGFGRVMANIERLRNRQQEAGLSTPLLVPEIVKVRETMPEIEPFFDFWHAHAGWANIAPFNHGAGQRPDRNVMPMAPPVRRPCVRLWDRLVVLADGRVVACDQDFAAHMPVGDLRMQTLEDVWHGEPMQRLRSQHLSGTFDSAVLCPRCDDWHRP